jgi:hypothetical protein
MDLDLWNVYLRCKSGHNDDAYILMDDRQLYCTFSADDVDSLGKVEQ